MAQISAEFVERYQIEYQRNPRSRIFAPLAEAYRKMGLLDEALRVCERGVSFHPDFAGGHVAYAKVLFDLKRIDEALKQAEKAAKLSPDNLLAQSLMGEAYLQLRRPKDALKAFKNVLLLSPSDQRARSIVKKWEFLSADEYEDELFKMAPVFEAAGDTLSDENKVERVVSLADAFTVRGENDRAIQILTEARFKIGPVPEIEKRLKLLAQRAQVKAIEIDDEDLTGDTSHLQRRQKLETFLRRINERRHDS